MREFERDFTSQEDFESLFQHYVPLKLLPIDDRPTCIYLDHLYDDQRACQFPPAEHSIPDLTPFSVKLHNVVINDISTGFHQKCCRVADKAVEIGSDIEHILFYQLCACRRNTHGYHYQDKDFFCPVPILMRVTSPVYKTSERINIFIDIPDLAAESYVYGEHTHSGMGYCSLAVKNYSHGFCIADYSRTNEPVWSWLSDIITDCIIHMYEERSKPTETQKDVSPYDL